MHLGKNIKGLREARKLTQEEFAKKLGISRSTLANYETEISKPEYDTLIRIANVLNVKLDDIINVDMKKAVLANVQDRAEGVPYYDLDATAGNIELSNHIPETIRGYINLPNFRDCIAFLNVRGDSMYPKYRAGDIIGLVPVTDREIIQWGQTYMLVTKDNQRMIKYLRRAKDADQLLLRSENDKYDDIHLPKKKVLKLFMVKGPIRDEWQ